MDAPNTSIAASSAAKLECSNTKHSDTPMASPQTAAVLRAPSRAMTLPAISSAETVPTATVSSTIDNVASDSEYRAVTDGMCDPHVPTTTPSTKN